MKKQTEKPCNTIDTLIGANTEIQGDISFTGGLRIDGRVVGNINGDSDKSSTLVLSEHAVVKGNVNVPHLVINGRIEGGVTGADSVELQSQAEIVGDVHYRMIEMALGASINGNLVREGVESKGSVTPLKTVAGGDDQEKI